MVRLMPFINHLHFPVFLPVSFPPSYRGRGNRGKGSAFLFSGHFGNRGKPGKQSLSGTNGCDL